MRITEAERELAMAQLPDHVKQTLQCQGCGRVYELRAVAFQRAS